MKKLLRAAIIAALPTAALASPAYVSRLDLPLRGATHTAPLDLDGDGDIDVAAVSESEDWLAIYYSNGDGTFGLPPEIYPLANCPAKGCNPVFVTGGDLIDDSLTTLPDLLVVTRTGTVPADADIEGDMVLYQNSGAPAGTAGRFATACENMYLDGTGSFNGNQPGYAVLANFNGDTRTDIVASSNFGNSLQLFFQSTPLTGCITPNVCGFGLKNNPTCAPMGTGHANPTAMVAGVFLPSLHPGVTDVVALNTASARISYHFHTNPDESAFLTLGPPQLFVGGGTSPNMLLGADLNIDGRTDLVMSNGGSGNLSVLLGRAAAGFGEPAFNGAINSGGGPVGPRASEYPAFEGPNWVALGEFELGPLEPGEPTPGFVDALVPNRPLDQVSVLPGVDDASFLNPLCYPVGDDPVQVATADFAGRGLSDALVTQKGALSVLLGRTSANGGFDLALHPRTDSLAAAIAAGDFDGDSNLDVVLANDTPHDLAVLRGLGDGRFEAVFNHQPLSAPPIAVVAAAFDADSADDVAVLTGIPGRVGVYLGIPGNGSLSHAGTLTVADGAAAMVAAPLVTGGDTDLVVLVPSPPGLWVLSGSGDGKFAAAVPELTLTGTPIGLVAGQFDAASGTDLCVLDGTAGTVQVIANDGIGGLTALTAVATGAVGANGFAAGYLDADSLLDLVVTYDNGQVVALIGDGAGGFVASAALSLLTPTYRLVPTAPVIGEFTGGGLGDLLVLLAESASALVLPWDSTANNLSWSSAIAYGLGTPRAAIAGPFDRAASNLDTVLVADDHDDLLPGVTVLSGRRWAMYPPVDAGPDREICAASPGLVSIGAPGKDYVDYSWSGVVADPGNPETTAMAAGSYTLTAANPELGLTNADTVEIRLTPAPVIDVQPNPAALCGGGPSSICLDAGPGHLNYTWSTGDQGRFLVVSPSVATTYDVTVTSTAGCTVAGSRTVSFGVAALAAGGVTPLSVCGQSAPIVFAADASATVLPPGASSLSYRWLFVTTPTPSWTIATPTAVSTTVTAAPPFTPASVVLRLEVTTNPGGCVTTQDFTLEVAPSGSTVDVSNSLRLAWTDLGHTNIAMSWDNASASSYDAHEVAVKPSITTIFATLPFRTVATNSVTFADATDQKFYQVQGACPP